MIPSTMGTSIIFAAIALLLAADTGKQALKGGTRKAFMKDCLSAN